MTMRQVISASEYNALQDYLSQAVDAVDSPFTGGKAKRDQMAHEAKIAGKLEGLAVGLSIYANQLRVSKFGRLEEIEAFSPDLGLMFLQQRIDALSESERDPVDPDNWRNEWENESRERFQQLVYADRLVNEEQQRRKDAILSGEEEPTDEDREWLQEEARRAQHEAEALTRWLGTAPIGG